MAKALIVSSDDVSRKIYELAIKFQKIQVLSARTIQEAISHIINDLPDLVVLDLETIDLKELELLKEVKKKAKDLPVIILTDMKKTEAQKKGCVIGACQVLQKEEATLGNLIKKTRITVGK